MKFSSVTSQHGTFWPNDHAIVALAIMIIVEVIMIALAITYHCEPWVVWLVSSFEVSVVLITLWDSRFKDGKDSKFFSPSSQIYADR
jgi:uncharacterized protein YqfA (UPF0365 family)